MRLLPAAAAFVVSFFAFALLFLAAPMIPDADSYFHLAVAREYASEGYVEALPWARTSVLGETFGDKELLFHVLLAPFASGDDAATGGRVALALLNAAFVAAVTGFATRSLGWWSLVVPVWLYVAAPMLTFRLIRLRPELLALLLLLALIRLAAARRYAWVAVVSALFALSYTAFHVVIGLAVLWSLATIRERDWKLPLAAAVGAAAGLLVHPGFPGNLRIWWIQNVLYFLHKSRLDVGDEIAPATTDFFFIANLGWWAGVALLWVVARSAPADRRRVLFSGIAAAVFAVLAILMQRMAPYFVSFATLALLVKIEARAPARTARLAMALLATALLSLPATIRIHRELLLDGGYEADYAAFGKAVPRGAKVAAHWGPSELYTFFAPQGRYLNVLDPVFMAAPHPATYAAQKRLFDGDEPDVPRVAQQVLDSDYIAFPSSSPLFDRVQFDPRIVPLHNGYTFLGRFAPEEARRFVRDWRGHPGTNAYVDARRVSRARCAQFRREETIATPVTRLYELAPYGTAELRIGDAVQLRAGPARAILGRGTLFRVHLEPGTHRFVVTTCAEETGENGFYLLRRSG